MPFDVPSPHTYQVNPAALMVRPQRCHQDSVFYDDFTLVLPGPNGRSL
jgi:hypothetical protein